MRMDQFILNTEASTLHPVEKLVCKFFAAQCIPFLAVEDPSFQTLIHRAYPTYNKVDE